MPLMSRSFGQDDGGNVHTFKESVTPGHAIGKGIIAGQQAARSRHVITVRLRCCPCSSWLPSLTWVTEELGQGCQLRHGTDGGDRDPGVTTGNPRSWISRQNGMAPAHPACCG